MGIKFKRSAVAGKVPAVADLELGEIAINTTDGRLFTKKSVSGTESIVPVGDVRTVAGRTGDVNLAIADVANLQTSLNGKAASVHGHAASDVSGLGALALLNAVGNSQISDGAVTLAKLATAVQALLVPAGSLVPFAGTSEPSGWLFCYGQAISRTTYAALFAAIGTSFGGGDGSTTFNVPDLRGRVVAGNDVMGGTAAGRLTGAGGVGGSFGSNGGAETQTLTVAQMPSHEHLVVTTTTGGTGLSGSSSVDYTASYNTNASYTLAGNQYPANAGRSSATGGGAAHSNVQPTSVLNYIIKF